MRSKTTTLVRVAAAIVLMITMPCAARQGSQDERPLGPTRSAPHTSGAAASSGGGTSIARTAGSLALVLGLIFAGAACYRKFASRHQGLAGAIGAGGRSPAGILEIVGRYPVGRGSSLVLLRLDRRILLLSQAQSPAGRGLLRPGAASLTTLCEVREAEEVASILAKAGDASGESMSAKFQSMLSTFAKGESPLEDNRIDEEAGADVSPAVVVRAGAWSSGVKAGEGAA